MKLNMQSSLVKRNRDNIMLSIILMVVVIIVSLISERFLSYNTFISVTRQFPEMGLLTLCMMITMITGGINLSCIASANLSGIIMAKMMTSMIPKGTENVGVVILAIIVGISISVLVSFGNGVIIAYLKVPAILVTLSMQMLISGVSIVITKGEIVSGFPESFQFIGNKSVLGIPVPLYIFAICAIIMYIVLHHLPLGQKAYMYGSNPTATEFSGVNVKRMIIKVYSLSGFFVGVAAVILTSRFNSAASGYATSYLLQSVLIAVLGGIDPNGGKGKISGMILAVLLLQIVASGLNILRVDQFLITALFGLILLATVAFRLNSFKKFFKLG
ncbi:ABC transporter permease [Vallitalea guaymasensis]|uniref:ABC transporter permease n=1 Tax=Vallitalea guaymasensis TaxID=1185412 RepID=UPI000DE41C68|nr:ABC transporter permease [Vallitalea guaymasensis]